jgi:tetratricopeptide (TPR) repeat protein
MVADALMGQANADDKLDNWDEALRLWRLAGKKYESIGDRRGMADALNHQALLAFNKDDAPTATQLLQQAMSLSKSIGDQAGIAYSLTLLGTVRMYVDPANGGDFAPALNLFSQAQAIYQETQNVAEEGNILSLFGDAASARMHYEEAKAYYLKAMALSEAANDKSRIANRLQDLGIVAERARATTRMPSETLCSHFRTMKPWDSRIGLPSTGNSLRGHSFGKENSTRRRSSSINLLPA